MAIEKMSRISPIINHSRIAEIYNETLTTDGFLVATFHPDDKDHQWGFERRSSVKVVRVLAYSGGAAYAIRIHPKKPITDDEIKDWRLRQRAAMFADLHSMSRLGTV